MKTLGQINVEVVERKDSPGDWGVEAIDFDGDGECFMAIFSGPQARERAIDYASWKFPKSTEKFNRRREETG